MAPLADTMGLIHRQKRHPCPPQQPHGRAEPFRRQIEQLQGSLLYPAHHSGIFFRCIAGGQRTCLNPGQLQGGHLIAHQGDERRDNDGQPVTGQCRQLITERLAATGRHDGEHILTGQNGADDLFLTGAEVVIAEDRLQDRSDC